MQAALFVPLVPIVTAVVDLLYFGELPSLMEALGMVVVVAGMRSAYSRRSRRRLAPEACFVPLALPDRRGWRTMAPADSEMSEPP